MNWQRNACLTMTGAFYLEPVLHVWYSKLMPQVVSRVTGGATAATNQNNQLGKFKSALPGMLFDQLLFAPLFLSGFFIFSSFVSDFKK